MLYTFLILLAGELSTYLKHGLLHLLIKWRRGIWDNLWMRKNIKNNKEKKNLLQSAKNKLIMKNTEAEKDKGERNAREGIIKDKLKL